MTPTELSSTSKHTSTKKLLSSRVKSKGSFTRSENHKKRTLLVRVFESIIKLWLFRISVCSRICVSNSSSNWKDTTSTTLSTIIGTQKLSCVWSAHKVGILTCILSSSTTSASAVSAVKWFAKQLPAIHRCIEVINTKQQTRLKLKFFIILD